MSQRRWLFILTLAGPLLSGPPMASAAPTPVATGIQLTPAETNRMMTPLTK